MERNTLVLLRNVYLVYVGPHTGTVPVLALGQKILPVVELGIYLHVVAPCVEFFVSATMGSNFV